MSALVSRPLEDRVATWAHRPAAELIRLAWPITITTLSYSAMTLAGTLFVARVGSDELAGVGLGGVVAFALICFAFGMLRGVKTVVAQALGAGRPERVDDYLGAGVGFAVLLGALALLGGQVLAPVAAHLCASPAAGRHAATYLRLRVLAAPLLLVYAALRETRYGEGDARTPMRASLLGNLLNIGVGATLIFGLGLGVTGAAVATIVGETAQLAVLAWPERARLRRLRWHRDAARAVWAQGAPTGLQFVMEVGSFLLLTATIASMSSVDGAAHQMVLQIVNVSFLPAHAVGEAASVLVGVAVGAGRFDLVRRIAGRALAVGLAYASLCMAVLAVLGGRIVGAMAGDDAALAATSARLVHVSLLFLVADAANVIARGVLRGTGDVRYPAAVGVITAWAMTPPLAWLLGVHAGLGAVGGWFGLAAEIILGASLFWWRVGNGAWRPAAEAARASLSQPTVIPGTESVDVEELSPPRNRLETPAMEAGT
ncbi:MAG: MATE family efflux transporter [Kofleriaceae bacterium]|nr:MATE family efflux transporter [Kofleriaceae bacterium]MCB9574964.1 MATE family efflux transporter [Kofleriaceae bacterium]